MLQQLDQRRTVVAVGPLSPAPEFGYRFLTHRMGLPRHGLPVLEQLGHEPVFGVVDVTEALNRRRYARAGVLGLRLVDELCPWNHGVYCLEVDADGTGHCRRTETPAPIELSAYALGAVYLGGHRFFDLARAGLVCGAAEVLQRADTMFAWEPRPWCQEMF